MKKKCLKVEQIKNFHTSEKTEETWFKSKSGSEETLQREKMWLCDIVVHFIKFKRGHGIENSQDKTLIQVVPVIARGS